MTFDEFKVIYQPLANKWPQTFAKQDFRETMFNQVKGFQLEWVKALVHKIIMTNNPTFNVLEEIEKEKRRRGFDQVNNDNSKEFERTKYHGSDAVFDSEIRKRGATTLWEAILHEKGKAKWG